MRCKLWIARDVDLVKLADYVISSVDYRRSYSARGYTLGRSQGRPRNKEEDDHQTRQSVSKLS